MDVSVRLLQAGLRATGKRLAIANVLADAGEPLDARQIYQSLIAQRTQSEVSVSLPTVYRTLSLLEEAEVVESIHLRIGGTRYRLASPESVDELVCERCGKVEELADTPALAAFRQNVVRPKPEGEPGALRIYTGCHRLDCD